MPFEPLSCAAPEQDAAASWMHARRLLCLRLAVCMLDCLCPRRSRAYANFGDVAARPGRICHWRTTGGAMDAAPSHCSGNVTVPWHELSSSSENDVLASLPRHQNLRKRGCAAGMNITDSQGETEAQQPASMHSQHTAVRFSISALLNGYDGNCLLKRRLPVRARVLIVGVVGVRVCVSSNDRHAASRWPGRCAAAVRPAALCVRQHYLLRDCCLLYTSPSPRDGLLSRMPSSA